MKRAELLAGRVLLIVLALVLPFEAPLCHVASLQLTTVEVALYATLLIGGLATFHDLVRRPEARAELTRMTREPLVAATLAWTLCMFASALAASSPRAAALKFALRSLSGVLLFFAARVLARSEATSRRIVAAAVAGALVSAVTAVVEVASPSSEVLLRLFRDRGFNAVLLPRATGVFGYPTIGAMYWESAVPLVVATSLWVEDRTKRALLLVGGTSVLAAAVLASGTRSAMAGVALVCLGLYGLAGRQSRLVGRAALVALGSFLAVSVAAVAASGGDSPLAHRMRFWNDGAWYRVEYTLDRTPRAAAPGEAFLTTLDLRNTGTLVWRSTGTSPTRLAHRWYRLDGDGGELTGKTRDGIRTPLPGDVPPGGTVHLSAAAEAPATPGSYALVWDLVQEDAAWFSESGNPMPSVEVTVGATEARGLSSLEAVSPGAPPPPGRFALWRAAYLLFRNHPLLGVGPDGFRHLYGTVLTEPARGRHADERVHANSFYLETLADMGIAGAIALLGLMAALGVELRRAATNEDSLGVGIAFAGAAFFVHGVSDYFLEFTPTFALFWLLLGLLAANRDPQLRP